MIKNYSLFLIAFLCSLGMGFGQQILTFEFSGLSGSEATASSNYNDVNLGASVISRGSGLMASANAGRFNATDWSTVDINDAVSNNNYMEFTITPNAGYQFSVSSIYIQLQRSSTGPSAVALRSSVDGYTTNLDTEYTIVDNTSTQNFTFTFSQANSTAAITYRFYMYAEASGGSGGIGDGTGNDIVVNGSVTPSCTDFLDYYSIQSPQFKSMTVGQNFNVSTEVYEPGITESAGAGTGIEVWIGYNTIDNDPSSAGWTWVPASFVSQSGNNDVFAVEIASALPTGTYFYASRFRLNGCGFTYSFYDNGGGDGIWDGVLDVNGVLNIVNTDQVDWCNLQFPEVGNITEGGIFDVYARVYEPGVTDAVGQGTGIECWIGYSAIDATAGNSINNSSTQTDFQSSNWTWIPAGYNQDYGNDDEYFVNIGSTLTAGTYYYASRFRLNSTGTYSYGGIKPPNGGNYWDGINYISGVLTVTSNTTTCASESFVNSGNSGSYGIETWTGDDGIDWTATDSRTDQDLNGNEAVMLRNGSLTNDSPFPNGCGVITFDYAQIYSGTSTLQVFVNGIQYGGDINVNSTTSTTFSTTVNVTGNINVELRNTGNRTLINNLSWTCNACATPIEATNFLATNGCDGISLNWDLGCAEEVMLVASQGSPVTVVPSGDGSAYTANTVFGSGTDLATGEYNVYEGTETSTTVTGLTNGATYYFTLFSRVGSNWSAGVTSSATYNVNVLNPATFSSYNRCGDILLTWTLPACHEEVLIIAKDTNPVTQAPSGDGSSYTASTIFGSGTEIGGIGTNEYIVYKGTGDQVTVTGLTNGNTYNFKIFTRVGTNWSSGAITTGLSDNGSGPSPTIFKPGDLVFVGFDSYIYGSTDKYSILNLVDIGPDTEFIMTNLLYEWNDPAGTSSGKWYTCAEDFVFDPEYALIKYTGCANIPKGSIICIETVGGSDAITSISVNGVTADTEFYIDPAHTRAGNISTSSADAIWFMQGSFSPVMTESDGPDGDSLDDRYRTFSGTVLGALQTKGEFKDISDNGYGFINGTTPDRISRIHPDVECLAIETGTASINATKFFAFYDGLTFNISNPPTYSLSQYEALALITDFGTNWQIQSSDDASVQDDDNIDFTCNTSFNISNTTVSEGQWVGGVSTDWFDCHNWQNFTVPDASVDVSINSISNGNCVIDPTIDPSLAAKYNNLAECNDITLDSSSYILSMPDNTSILNLYGNWINNVGQNFFDEGNGTVVFTGSLTQIIQNNATPLPPITTEEFYNVTLNNHFDTGDSNNLYVNGDLTINSGKILNVDSNDYVYVNNKVTNNGTFHIEDSASLIQSGDGTNTNVGKISMERTANNLQLLDYVYWSSPINEFYVNDIFNTTSNIYKWSPTAINGNGGQGNWVSAAGEPMSVGEGYIARVPNTLIGTSITANFDVLDDTAGKPNNGDINVTITKGSNIGVGNSSGDSGAVAISIYDDNWNLVGNPYPSAIDAIDFLTTNNTSIDGFVYLWRHLNAPNATTSDPFYDDFEANYADSDYVAYNATGTSTPIGFNGYIGAGQSFLVNMLESASSPSTVVFNNSMRDIFNDNSQFYRTVSNEKHRIWLNLYNSNDIIINTILVGYASGATMGKDRMYDAVTNAGSTKIYSLINDEKFIIQGRALPFEVTDHIPLGLAVSTTGGYYIGLADVDGLFETQNQMVYLKDNYLNLTYNISEDPYSFSAEPGEFNDRFEIVFQTTTLSTDETLLSANDLTIIELPDGSVKFKVDKSHTIAQVEIIDLLGRTLYTLKGTSSESIYFLPQLSQSAYIAKVTLDNGQTLSKKAIKKH